MANQELSRLRMVVEHVFAAMKPFRALADRFRHTVEVHQDVFTVIAALVNRRTRKRLPAQVA